MSIGVHLMIPLNNKKIIGNLNKLLQAGYIKYAGVCYLACSTIYFCC